MQNLKIFISYELTKNIITMAYDYQLNFSIYNLLAKKSM